MFIHTYEKSKRGDACRSYLDGCPLFDKIKYILLPIPTFKMFKDKQAEGEFWQRIDRLDCCGTVFAGYEVPRAVANELTERGAMVLDSGKDEDFLAENAALTAKGALGKILTSVDRDLTDMFIGVVGFGRIGSALTRMLLSLGAKVRVYSGRKETVLNLCSAGVSAERTDPYADLNGIDILVNTAPASVFDTTRAEFQGKMRVIDLASGENFLNVPVEKYASIPAAMFPISAGRLWAESIIRLQGGELI